MMVHQQPAPVPGGQTHDLSFLRAPGESSPSLRLVVRLQRSRATTAMILRHALADRDRPAATMLAEIKAALRAAGEAGHGLDAADAVVVCWQERRAGPNESWRTVVTEDNFDAVVMLLGRDGAATVVEVGRA